MKELQKHTGKDDCWVAIDGIIYNVTSYLPNHPVGSKMIPGGTDITEKFKRYHSKHKRYAKGVAVVWCEVTRVSSSMSERILLAFYSARVTRDILAGLQKVGRLTRESANPQAPPSYNQVE